MYMFTRREGGKIFLKKKKNRKVGNRINKRKSKSNKEGSKVISSTIAKWETKRKMIAICKEGLTIAIKHEAGMSFLIVTSIS